MLDRNVRDDARVDLVLLAIGDGLLRPRPRDGLSARKGLPKSRQPIASLDRARCSLLFRDSRGFCSAGRDAIGCAMRLPAYEPAPSRVLAGLAQG
jgi:hypothetical protein